MESVTAITLLPSFRYWSLGRPRSLGWAGMKTRAWEGQSINSEVRENCKTSSRLVRMRVRVPGRWGRGNCFRLFSGKKLITAAPLLFVLIYRKSEQFLSEQNLS